MKAKPKTSLQTKRFVLLHLFIIFLKKKSNLDFCYEFTEFILIFISHYLTIFSCPQKKEQQKWLKRINTVKKNILQFDGRLDCAENKIRIKKINAVAVCLLVTNKQTLLLFYFDGVMFINKRIKTRQRNTKTQNKNKKKNHME